MARRASAGRAEGAGGAAPMLRRATAIQGVSLAATDGVIGTVEDLYFEDQSWTVRYLVVDTGGWLSGRKVLLSPRVVEGVDAPGERIVTRLTRQQVQDSPGVDTDKPVSRQQEIRLATHYGYPHYWSGPYRWGPMPYPTAAPFPLTGPATGAEGAGPSGAQDELAGRGDEAAGDPHLRSARQVKGYGIRAADGDLGHVADFLFDEAAWAIRYLIVDPKSWWPGPHVIISVEWVTDVSWTDGVVAVGVDRETVKSAPTLDTSGTLDRTMETRLHQHYGRAGYWDRPPESWTRWPPAA